MTHFELDFRPRVLDTFEVIDLGWIVEALAANDNEPAPAAPGSLAAWTPQETLEHYA